MFEVITLRQWGYDTGPGPWDRPRRLRAWMALGKDNDIVFALWGLVTFQ